MRICDGQVLYRLLNSFVDSFVLLFVSHEQKIIFLFVTHVDNNLFQILLGESIPVILELIVIFFGLPLVVNFIQLLYVIELCFELRHLGLFAMNFLLEDAIDETLDFLVGR